MRWVAKNNNSFIFSFKMKKFIVTILLYSLPLVILLVTIVWLDFFKVLGFQDYYSDQTVGLNRGMVTTSTCNHQRNKEKYNSFIFGSSRSQAFKCENWMNYLDNSATPYHFDGSGDGVWDIAKKLKYIDKLGDSIHNALVIIDRNGLRRINQKEGHLFISMPCVSGRSYFKYYATLLEAACNPNFLRAYLDYSITGVYKDYMGYLIKKGKHNHVVNDVTCDIWYSYDKEIKMDSLQYYNTLSAKGVFYNRDNITRKKCKITAEEKKGLLTIEEIFTKHHTNYKIVISPIYNQVPMEKDQVNLLNQVFGKENVYNFSGKNELTTPIHNYYESSHYRPHVANRILEIIYK